VDRVGNFGPACYTSADIADKADEDRLALLEPHEATRLRSKYERAGVLDPAAGTGPSARIDRSGVTHSDSGR
jgi:hypothetical protein